MPHTQNNIELRQERTCCVIKTPVEHRQRAPVAGKWKLSVEKQQLFHMVRKKNLVGCCGIFSFQFSFPLQLRLANYPAGEASQRQSWSLFCFYCETTTNKWRKNWKSIKFSFIDEKPYIWKWIVNDRRLNWRCTELDRTEIEWFRRMECFGRAEICINSNLKVLTSTTMIFHC